MNSNIKYVHFQNVIVLDLGQEVSNATTSPSTSSTPLMTSTTPSNNVSSNLKNLFHLILTWFFVWFFRYCLIFYKWPESWMKTKLLSHSQNQFNYNLESKQKTLKKVKKFVTSTFKQIKVCYFSWNCFSLYCAFFNVKRIHMFIVFFREPNLMKVFSFNDLFCENNRTYFPWNLTCMYIWLCGNYRNLLTHTF